MRLLPLAQRQRISRDLLAAVTRVGVNNMPGTYTGMVITRNNYIEMSRNILYTFVAYYANAAVAAVVSQVTSSVPTTPEREQK